MNKALKTIDEHIERLRTPRYKLKIPIGTRADMRSTANLMEKLKVAIVAAMTFDDAGADEGVSGHDWDELAVALDELEADFLLGDDEPIGPPSTGRCY